MEQRQLMNTLQKENHHLVRLGVIGAGLVGAKHTAIADDLLGCRLVRIADPNPAVGRLTEELAVDCYNNYKERNKAFDGVTIATPTVL